jgi:hypothetical protein
MEIIVAVGCNLQVLAKLRGALAVSMRLVMTMGLTHREYVTIAAKPCVAAHVATFVFCVWLDLSVRSSLGCVPAMCVCLALVELLP